MVEHVLSSIETPRKTHCNAVEHHPIKIMVKSPLGRSSCSMFSLFRWNSRTFVWDCLGGNGHNHLLGFFFYLWNLEKPHRSSHFFQKMKAPSRSSSTQWREQHHKTRSAMASSSCDWSSSFWVFSLAMSLSFLGHFTHFTSCYWGLIEWKNMEVQPPFKRYKWTSQALISPGLNPSNTGKLTATKCSRRDV